MTMRMMIIVYFCKSNAFLYMLNWVSLPTFFIPYENRPLIHWKRPSRLVIFFTFVFFHSTELPVVPVAYKSFKHILRLRLLSRTINKCNNSNSKCNDMFPLTRFWIRFISSFRNIFCKPLICSPPDVFSSCSFIPRAHFETSSVVVNFYSYEIWPLK